MITGNVHCYWGCGHTCLLVKVADILVTLGKGLRLSRVTKAWIAPLKYSPFTYTRWLSAMLEGGGEGGEGGTGGEGREGGGEGGTGGEGGGRGGRDGRGGRGRGEDVE